MRIFLALVAFISGMSSGLAAFAATVNVSQGQVLLNRGAGYQRVTGSAQAGPGAMVVANPGGGGQIVYPDGCVVEVQPGSVYTVATKSPCQSGCKTPCKSERFAFDDHTLIMGGLVVGGAIGAGILLSQGKPKPASP